MKLSRDLQRLTLTAICVLLGATACPSKPPLAREASFSAPTIEARSVSLDKQSVVLVDGSTLAFEQGFITVPTQRGVVGSKPIQVEFHRFFAQQPTDAPAIIQLKGGPGVSSLDKLIQRPGYAETWVLPSTVKTDLVIMGQRGFANSGALDCERPAKLTLTQAMDRSFRDQAASRAVRACRQTMVDQGVELAGYSVPQMAADAVEVADALGYERFQLLGSSFGSHVGMALLRAYPDRVVRATFNALEGPDHTYDAPSGKWAALEKIAALAERSPALKAAIPQNGLMAAYREVVAQAKLEPLRVSVTVPDTDDTVEVALTAEDLTGLPFLLSTTFSNRWPRWALAMIDVANGRLEEEVEELLWRWMNPRVDAPAALQMDCGSGVSVGRAAKLRADPAAEWTGKSNFFDECPVWGADLGEGFRSDFATDVPVLLMHGTHDTATPYGNALELLSSFTDHHFIRVEGGSHGAILEAMDDVTFRDQLTEWFASGAREQFPTWVEVAPPNWSAP